MISLCYLLLGTDILSHFLCMKSFFLCVWIYFIIKSLKLLAVSLLSVIRNLNVIKCCACFRLVQVRLNWNPASHYSEWFCVFASAPHPDAGEIQQHWVEITFPRHYFLYLFSHDKLSVTLRISISPLGGKSYSGACFCFRTQGCGVDFTQKSFCRVKTLLQFGSGSGPACMASPLSALTAKEQSKRLKVQKKAL